MTTTENTTMARLADVERWLDEHRISWRLEDVDLDDVDQRAGLRNQTRLDALNADAVDRYTADMQAGAVFPPLILRRGDDRRWLPVDGNHRCTAARNAGRTVHPAYLVEDLTASQAHELAIVANRTHGLPLTDEERLWHAVSMVHDGTMSIERSAEAVGVTADKLRRRLASEKFVRRAVKLQMTGWEEISESNRHVLQSIKDDMVFRRAVRLAGERRILSAEIPPLVARINTSSVSAALDELSELDKESRERRSPGRPPAAATSPRKRLLGDLDILIARFTANAVAEDCTTDAAREQVAQQIKVAVRHLIKIHDTVAGRRLR